MGDAKRRAAGAQVIDPEVIRRCAVAVQKLCMAASTHLGADCWTHAAIGKALLERVGIRAEIVGGEAAWRVGEGDGDVIQHGGFGQPVQHGGPQALPYHAWLEVSGRILDLTTYLLPDKAQQLDAMDGGHTTVSWCPDYLFVEKVVGRSMPEVRQQHAGLFHYRRDLAIEGRLKRASVPPEEGEIAAAWIIFQNPDITVAGPNVAPPRP